MTADGVKLNHVRTWIIAKIAQCRESETRLIPGLELVRDHLFSIVRPMVSPYVIYCVDCGPIEIQALEYNKVVQSKTKQFHCPSCKMEATFDDKRHAESVEYLKALQQAGRSPISK